MPPLSENPTSFFGYKSLLYDSLSRSGFNPKGDISTKDLDQTARAQVVVAGNNFFLSLNLQISFPSATMEVERKDISYRRSRLHSQDVYFPVFSFDAAKIPSLENSKYLAATPNWRNAAEDLNMLIEQICCAYSDYMEKGIYNGSIWWPSRLNEIQKQIIAVVLDKGGIEGSRLTILGELL